MRMTAWNQCRNRCGALARYRTGRTCRPCQKRAWYARNRDHAITYNARYYGWAVPNSALANTIDPANTNSIGAHSPMIKTLTELVERLEALKADIPVTGLTLTEYEQVGWARRPLEGLIERCRGRIEDLSWQEHDAIRAEVLALPITEAAQ